MIHPSFSVPTSGRRRRSRRVARSPESIRGLLYDFSSYGVGPISSKSISTNKSSDNPSSFYHKDKAEFSLFKCSTSGNKENMIGMENVLVDEVKSVTQDFSPGPFNDAISYPTWMNDTTSDERVRSNSMAEPLPVTPFLSTACDIESWLNPGSVVWAKTACHDWWPAKVLNEKDALQCITTDSVGQVLVQFYGNHEQAWLDPAEDLSQFDCCYEERSKNPLERFQEALQQALYNCASTSHNLAGGRSTNDVKILQLCDSGRKSNHQGAVRRSGRQRKLKVHFDEARPEKQTKTPRRIKIMRLLGLMAPVGSPFAIIRKQDRRAAH